MRVRIACARVVCVCVYVRRVCVRAARVCVCDATFSGGEHGGGQLTLLGLQVSQGEPAGVPAGHHGDPVVGVTHIP